MGRILTLPPCKNYRFAPLFFVHPVHPVHPFVHFAVLPFSRRRRLLIKLHGSQI
jgi:hypothetical protein